MSRIILSVLVLLVVGLSLYLWLRVSGEDPAPRRSAVGGLVPRADVAMEGMFLVHGVTDVPAFVETVQSDRFRDRVSLDCQAYPDLTAMWAESPGFEVKAGVEPGTNGAVKVSYRIGEYYYSGSERTDAMKAKREQARVAIRESVNERCQELAKQK